MFRFSAMRLAMSGFAILAAVAIISAQPSVDQRATQIFNKAIEQYNARQYDAAIANYTEYLKLKPNSSAAYFNRGLALYNKSQASPSEPLYRQAAADFSKAIELKPTDAEYWTSRGSVYTRLMSVDYARSLEQAIADFTQAIKLNPNFASAYRERGVVYEQSNQMAKALPDLNTAIRLDPKDATAYYTRAKVHGMAKRYAAAKADAETAIRIFPNYEAAKIYRDYINGEIAKASVAKPQPKATPVAKTTVTPKPPKTAPTAAPSRSTNTGKAAPVRPTTTKVTKPDPAAIAAAIMTVADGFNKAQAAATAKDHPLVVALATRSLQLLPMKTKHQPTDDLMFSVFTELLKMRARSLSELGKHAESDSDYFDITESTMKETLRRMQAANREFENDKSGISGYIGASVEMIFAVPACRSGFQTGIEWMDVIQAKRPNDTSARLKSSLSVLGLREMCSAALMMKGSNKRGESRTSFANKAKLLNEAIEAYNEAATFTPRDARVYAGRARVYRDQGRNDLAAADEAKARELEAAKKNPN